jgi:hypothetical protein
MQEKKKTNEMEEAEDVDVEEEEAEDEEDPTTVKRIPQLCIPRLY